MVDYRCEPAITGLGPKETTSYGYGFFCCYNLGPITICPFVPYYGGVLPPDAPELYWLWANRVDSPTGHDLLLKQDARYNPDSRCDCVMTLRSADPDHPAIRLELSDTTYSFLGIKARVAIDRNKDCVLTLVGYRLGQQKAIATRTIPAAPSESDPCEEICIPDAPIVSAKPDSRPGLITFDEVVVTATAGSNMALHSLRYTLLRQPQLHVALTFDFGPDPVPAPPTGHENGTQQALDLLKNNGKLPGTFFLEHMNVVDPRSLPLLERFRSEGHEVGLSGVNPHALHCSYAVTKQVNRAGACSDPNESAGECFDRMLKSAKAALTSRGFSPRFVRTPIGEHWLCKDINPDPPPKPPESRKLGNSTNCPAFPYVDEGLTMADIKKALANSGLKPYLHGGAAVPYWVKGNDRRWGPSSWVYQGDNNDQRTHAVREMMNLIGHLAKNGGTQCAVILCHDFLGIDKTFRDQVKVTLGWLPWYLDMFLTEAERVGVNVHFERLSDLASHCGSIEPFGLPKQGQGALVCGLDWA